MIGDDINYLIMEDRFRPDPKPEKREKKKEVFVDWNKVKRYSCKYCHEKYEMKIGDYNMRKGKVTDKCCMSVDCLTRAAMRVVDEKRKADKRAWKKKKEKMKEELGIRKKGHRDDLQKAINDIVKLIDKGKNCIARPFERSGRLDAGHIYSVGAYPSLRYHMWNIHGQSVKSNRDMGGESLMMLDGVERRYGMNRRREVEDLRKRYPVLKLNNQEKREALRRAREIIRGWVEDPKSRDEVNSILEIYK